jgi:hypothetical protein
MKKLFIGIMLSFCMTLTLLKAISASASTLSTTDAAASAHGRLADGGYNIYSLSGNYVTVDTYPSLRSVELSFPDSVLKMFYVENKGDNQITLKVEDSYSKTGYSYVGIDSSIKDGTALKLVDSPYLWNTYAENNTSLVFSLRPSTDTKMLASASGGKSAPRTKLILWTKPDIDAPKHGELRFEPVAESTKTPVAADYSFANLNQTQGSVTPVKIETSSSTKSPGEVTVIYNGSTALPKKPGSYSVTFNVAAAPPVWKEANGLKGGTLVIAPKPSTAAPVGKVIKMGGISWRVLDVQDGKALVLSDLILECMPFQKSSYSNAWTDSSLRAYLNGDFYKKTFSSSEKKRILSTKLVNNINSQYTTTYGTDTNDKVFLLSADEAARYFGKDKDRIAYADRRTPALLYSPINSFAKNPYEGVYQNYSTWFWWLRTPGQSGTGDHEALYVNLNGEVKSYEIGSESIGVRPAMWIKVEGGSFSKYQPLNFNKQPKYFTMEDMVKAIAQDIIYEYTGDWVYNFGYPARGPGVSKTQSSDGGIGVMPPGYAEGFHVYRMRCWGVLPIDSYDPFAKVTYGQFKDYLMKTMEWNKKYGAGGSKNYTLTKEILTIAEKRAGIKDTKANAKPVKAEIKRLSREIIYWLKAANDANTKRARILESPTKTEYKVGEEFDITGLLVVTGLYGKETNVNNKLTFTTSGVTLKPGRPFQSAGNKSIEISYNGQKLMTYPVTVKK